MLQNSSVGGPAEKGVPSQTKVCVLVYKASSKCPVKTQLGEQKSFLQTNIETTIVKVS